MPNLVVAPLPDGCPWSGWTPPNVDWCEEELCGWIVNPADTWSNLAYIVFGIAMALHARGRASSVLSLFAPASVVGLLIAAILAQEASASRRRRAGSGVTDYRPFFIGLALLVAAAAFSLADVTRAFCDPANHWLRGHAIWHLLTAASLYAMFRFYAEIEDRAAR